MFGKGGGESVILRSFYTGTSGIILRISSVISQQGIWDLKTSAKTSKAKNLNSTEKPLPVGKSHHNLLRGH